MMESNCPERNPPPTDYPEMTFIQNQFRQAHQKYGKPPFNFSKYGNIPDNLLFPSHHELLLRNSGLTGRSLKEN
jgi:hypothetical protein